MTKILPKVYYDDVDNHYQIKKFLSTYRHKTFFLAIYEYLVGQQRTAITSPILRQICCISIRQDAYYFLDSLVILNLLSKQKGVNRKEMIFQLNNIEWWHMFKKRLDDEGRPNSRPDTQVS